MNIRQQAKNFFNQLYMHHEGSTLVRRTKLVFGGVCVFVFIVVYSIFDAVMYFLSSLKDYLTEFWGNVIREWSE